MSLFMEQFGPMRYVHSRRSGLITFGGGGGGGPSLAEIKTAVAEYVTQSLIQLLVIKVILLTILMMH